MNSNDLYKFLITNNLNNVLERTLSIQNSMGLGYAIGMLGQTTPNVDPNAPKNLYDVIKKQPENILINAGYSDLVQDFLILEGDYSGTGFFSIVTSNSSKIATKYTNFFLLGIEMNEHTDTQMTSNGYMSFGFSENFINFEKGKYNFFYFGEKRYYYPTNLNDYNNPIQETYWFPSGSSLRYVSSEKSSTGGLNLFYSFYPFNENNTVSKYYIAGNRKENKLYFLYKGAQGIHTTFVTTEPYIPINNNKDLYLTYGLCLNYNLIDPKLYWEYNIIPVDYENDIIINEWIKAIPF